MHLQSSMREFAHAILQDFRVVIFFIFFFKTTIYLLEPVEVLNVFRFAGGVHGHEAIISLLSRVSIYSRLLISSIVTLTDAICC